MAVELNPWVEYEFRIVATNKIGTGDPSAPSRVIRTNEAGKERIKCYFYSTIRNKSCSNIIIDRISVYWYTSMCPVISVPRLYSL